LESRYRIAAEKKKRKFIEKAGATILNFIFAFFSCSVSE